LGECRAASPESASVWGMFDARHILER
jgi:hypothetical protein